MNILESIQFILEGQSNKKNKPVKKPYSSTGYVVRALFPRIAAGAAVGSVGAAGLMHLIKNNN